MALSQRVKRSRSKLIYSPGYWVVLGTILILIGFVLAHLSNANVIQWRAGWEKTAHITFHILGPIIVLLGIIKWVIDRIRR